MTSLEHSILAFVQRPGYKPLKPDGLARKLKLTKRDLPAFREALNALLFSGQISQGARDLIRSRSAAGTLVGILRKISSGAGYVIPHDASTEERGPGRDVFIDAKDVRDAHTGDEVLVKLLARRRTAGQRCGRIEEVLVRATTKFVGTYFEKEGQPFVLVDGRTFSEPIVIDDPGAKRPRVHDKVVLEMIRFPSHMLPGEGVLVEVLGERGAPGVDTLSIIHEFGLPEEFSEEALDEARLAVQQFDETDLSDRRDLTGETIVTIDPVDARDFDDAISLDRTKDGHWHLGVHIADVAAFVPPKGPLDEAALERGNSVYLPDRVIPMLPEVLSNGLASLQQGKVRYTKSVFIEFTTEGTPVHTEFDNSAIRVKKRFAYEQVMPIVREEEGAIDVSGPVRGLLQRMYELAMILRRRRLRDGALELSLAEVRLRLDDENRVTGAYRVPHDESHQIIEEFMLAANVAVAQKLTDMGIPFLRRVHGDPSEIRLRALAQFAAAVGFPLKKYQSRFDLQDLLKRVAGKPEETAVNFALLRSLKQADYSGKPLGHYALAAENYCHFTSPIRRYPDLTVHRLLDEIFKRQRYPHVMNDLALEKVGRHCSMTERRADDAERELTKVKLLTFVAGRIGEELDARITGVEPFGIFCQGVEIPIEGLIHITALDPGEYFDHDAATFTLVGRRRGKRYRLGDTVRVAIAHVDVDRRQLDFRLLGSKSRTASSDAANPKGERKPKRPAESSSPSPRGRREKGTSVENSNWWEERASGGRGKKRKRSPSAGESRGGNSRTKRRRK